MKSSIIPVDEAMADFAAEKSMSSCMRTIPLRCGTTVAAFRWISIPRERFRPFRWSLIKLHAGQVQQPELQGFGRLARRWRELRQRSFRRPYRHSASRWQALSPALQARRAPGCPDRHWRKCGRSRHHRAFQAGRGNFRGPEIFHDILKRFGELAYLNSGLVIECVDERTGLSHVFRAEGGIIPVRKRLEQRRAGPASHHFRLLLTDNVKRWILPCSTIPASGKYSNLRQQYSHNGGRHPPGWFQDRPLPAINGYIKAQPDLAKAQKRHPLAVMTCGRA